MNRRSFLKTTSVAIGATYLDRDLYAKKYANSPDKKLQKRKLGKTGKKLSIIGFGGIVVKDVSSKFASEVVERSIEKGVNYFDVAPSYGNAEVMLGPALKPFRDKVFLACKTGERDAKGAEKELHQSLKNLKTDYFDLYQLHAIEDPEEDVKAALSKSGAIQTFIKARDQGLIKYLGFSAHSPEAALLAMSEFEFDTILYPINFCTHYKGKFSQEVLKEAKKRGMGILALKSIAKQTWQNEEDELRHPKCWYEPIEDPFLAEDALSWTLSQGVTAAIPPGDENLYKMALQIGPNVKSLSNEIQDKLKKVAEDLDPIFSA